jgi:hypothetical protein
MCGARWLLGGWCVMNAGSQPSAPPASPIGGMIGCSRGCRKRCVRRMVGGSRMGSIKLPKVLTPAVIRAVTAMLHRTFDAWVAAERTHASSQELAQLQAAYDHTNATYHEALDRAAREGVHDATP